MGRSLLSSFLADLVDNIKRIITSQTKRSVVKSLQKVMSTLLPLDAVVDYAEEKQFGGGRYAQAVKDWLNEVQDALYQLDEILLQNLTTISSLDRHPLLGWQFVRIMEKKAKPGKKFKAQILDTLKNLESLVKKIGVLGLTVEPVTKRWMESSGDLYSTSDVLDNYPKYDFLGRNEEVKTILDYLLSTTTESEQHIKVINIVGFAGVGKTSLVDVIYSNHKVRESFKLRAQITVPYIANLTVKNIVEEITGNFCGGEDEDFDFLCKILQERCGGKKCLLVLDDIRIEDSLHNWSKLIASFETGAARGSAIILTSIPLYDPKQLMIPATHTVHLSSLSTENCLSIFMGHAWRQTDNLEKKIVNKLGNLPLALKMTGSLLQDKLDLNPQWDKILCEFLDGTNLLPIPSFLVMCYLDLPAPVKRCFAYLSLFPKSYHFRQKEVICQWMAQGFLKNTESGKSMEDTGDAYLGYLIKRSFLQPAFGYNDRFMMHNLVHDLAIYVFGESYKHHLCYDRRMEDFPAKSILKHGRSLRTIMPVYLPTERGNSEFDPEMLQPVIMKLSQHVFRVLSLSHYKITSLPASIGELRHLCYLNVSYTNLKELPDSICDLLNLQTLLLRGCYSLTTLPDRLCNLVNLRHLDFQGSSLQRMPPNMHNLTSLLILTDFIVSDTGPRLGDLAGLSNLKVLAISNLQNVAHANDASDAKLKEKGLADLWLSWDYVHDSNRYGNEMEVLKKLEPSHKDLKILKVTYYPGARFPRWLGDPSYSALLYLDLYYCENFESLPTLGLLPFLRELYIGRFTRVSSVGLEFYGEMTASQKPFQSLKVLRFSHMPEWKKWNIVEGIEFPHLVHLCILQCPKLVGDLPNELPSLKKLEIIGCTHLVAPLPNVSDTCEMFVHNSHSQPSLDLDKVTVPQKVHEITPVPNSGFRGTSTASEIEEILHGSLMETESVVSRFPFSSSSDTTMSPRPKETSSVVFSHQVEAETGSQSSMVEADIPITTQAAVIPPTNNTPSTTAPFNNEEAGNPRSSFEVLKVSTVSQLKSLPPTLHTLKIEGCEYLEAIRNGLLAGLTSLKELYLISCGSLKSLPSLGSLAFLHHLFIGSSCDSLTTLTLDFFPKLKNLCIWDCSNLQSFNVIKEIKGDLQSLESLEIRDCPRLMSFPEGGLHAPNLESIFLSNCQNLNNLPDGMTSLTSLKTLFLHKCPEIESFPYGGLPSSLILLSVAYCDKLIPQKNWRLDTLESLNRLELEGHDTSSNISSLRISTLKSLKKLNYRGFQYLNALHTLEIHCCDLLHSLPDEELPSSLNQLCVQECPLLTPRLKPKSGKEWHKVARIPHIQIDHQIIC
ncbi:hypothetical protein AAHE18_03G086200 [Arachis hypogaea]